jgi:hypothetical protein
MTLPAIFPTSNSRPAAPAAVTPSSERTRRRWRPEEKATLVAQFKQSGQTAADFCRRQGLSHSSFSGWCRQRHQAGAPHAGRFAAVHLAAPPAAGGSVVTVQIPSGCSVTAPLGADPRWLGQLVAALR